MSPSIPGIPEQFANLKGVEMRPPPLEYLSRVNKLVETAVEALPADANGRLVWVANEKGVNLVAVQKIGSHVRILGYIGKTWGDPYQAGIVGQVTW